MTLKALMVDVDGVVIRHPGGQRWDARLAEDLGIDPAALQERFFRVHFDEVTAGRADLFDRLALVLPELELAEHFHAMHYSADVGYAKTDPGFYRVVESRTQLPAGEHCLIDDSVANVEAARSQGWHAHLWTTDSRLADVLRP